MRKKGEGMKEIQMLRARIDTLDDRLLRLLSRRAQLAIEVGHLKRRTGLSARSSIRERAILQRMAHANAGPLDAPSVRKIFQMIVRESRRTAIREISK